MTLKSVANPKRSIITGCWRKHCRAMSIKATSGRKLSGRMKYELWKNQRKWKTETKKQKKKMIKTHIRAYGHKHTERHTHAHAKGHVFTTENACPGNADTLICPPRTANELHEAALWSSTAIATAHPSAAAQA